MEFGDYSYPATRLLPSVGRDLSFVAPSDALTQRSCLDRDAWWKLVKGKQVPRLKTQYRQFLVGGGDFAPRCALAQPNSEGGYGTGGLKPLPFGFEGYAVGLVIQALF